MPIRQFTQEELALLAKAIDAIADALREFMDAVRKLADFVVRWASAPAVRALVADRRLRWDLTYLHCRLNPIVWEGA